MTAPTTDSADRAQVKICGITRIKDAAACVRHGADAIGFVFYKKSPRYVSSDQARRIIQTLPADLCKVGIFVNESYDTITDIVKRCGLTAVQLHGRETAALIEQLRRQNLIVIKGLYLEGEPSIDGADDFAASAFLVECKKGVLPGGNAMTWDWGAAAEFGCRYPLVLAGGLSPDNVVQAMGAAEPDAVDVSSGVEAAPGIKDSKLIGAFIAAVKNHGLLRPPRRIFDV